MFVFYTLTAYFIYHITYILFKLQSHYGVYFLTFITTSFTFLLLFTFSLHLFIFYVLAKYVVERKFCTWKTIVFDSFFIFFLPLVLSSIFFFWFYPKRILWKQLYCTKICAFQTMLFLGALQELCQNSANVFSNGCWLRALMHVIPNLATQPVS